MKIKIVVHEAEEGGFWAEVPAIPGCASQGGSMDELIKISRKRLKDVFPLKLPLASPAAPSGCWNFLHE
jgi:hypothetical protein